MTLKPYFVLIGCLGVAACSESAPSFDEMADQGNALLIKYENVDATPDSSMPVSGSATYKGVAAFSDVSDADYIAANAEVASTVTLAANFGSNTISGQLENFRDFNDNPIPGSLALSNGSIAGSGVSADLSGTLNPDGTPLLVDAALVGGFLGPNAEAVAGAIGGTIDGFDIYGIFGAEK